jgi:hypothetical protein
VPLGKFYPAGQSAAADPLYIPGLMLALSDARFRRKGGRLDPDPVTRAYIRSLVSP